MENNIMYFAKGGWNGFWHNRAMSLSSIIIVIASLGLVGIYILFSMNLNYISRQFSSQYTITAYIEKGTPDDRQNEMLKEIKEIDGIKNISYTSEKEALEECREMFGESEDFLEGIEEENPLRASFNITVKDLNQVENISENIEKITDIVWVKTDNGVVSKIIKGTAFIRKGNLLLMLLFGAIAIFIISNTIKITILARKDDIFTMRYLGATNSFIRCPFIMEGMIIGFSGALLSFILVFVGYVYCVKSVDSVLHGILNLYPPYTAAANLLLIFMTLGICLGAFGSAVSIKKYLRV